MRRSVTLITAALVLAGSAVGAAAQEPSVRNATIAPGKVARVAVVTALKRDCSLGEVGSIKVVTPPRNGSIEVRGGKLKTPASFRCPNVESPTQQVFYKPNANFSGTDELAYEARSPDGAVQSVTVKITVTAKPGGKKDILDL